MRARLALVASGQQCELREVALKHKPADMLTASPKGTVPVLVAEDGTGLEQVTFDQSFDGFPMITNDGKTLVWETDRNAPNPGRKKIR